MSKDGRVVWCRRFGDILESHRKINVQRLSVNLTSQISHVDGLRTWLELNWWEHGDLQTNLSISSLILIDCCLAEDTVALGARRIRRLGRGSTVARRVRGCRIEGSEISARAERRCEENDCAEFVKCRGIESSNGDETVSIWDGFSVVASPMALRKTATGARSPRCARLSRGWICRSNQPGASNLNAIHSRVRVTLGSRDLTRGHLDARRRRLQR